MRAAFAQSRLPLSWQEERIERILSVDCQFYARCRACGFEHRVDQLAATSGKRRLKDRCLKCGKRKLEYVSHLLVLAARCEDCGRAFTLEEGAEPGLACPQCGSRRLVIEQEEFSPPFPSEFGDLGRLSVLVPEAPYVWGRSPSEDADRVHELTREYEALYPGRPGYLYTLIPFAARLRQACAEGSADERYILSNAAGNLCQDYFRETGILEFAGGALDYFEDMIVAAGEEGSAIAKHSYAMGVFSVLARYPEDYAAAALGRSELRSSALRAAREAAGALEGFLEQPEPGTAAAIASQLARVRFVIGDLLRIGASDDDTRRQAVEYFTAALEDEPTAQHIGFGIRAARAEAIVTMSDPEQELFDLAVEDLQSAGASGGSDAAYADQWRSWFHLGSLIWRHGTRQQAISPLERASSLALSQFNAMGDEVQLLYQAERFALVFEKLAALYVDLGWVDEALSAIEITRAASIRLYTMAGQARDAWVSELQDRFMESLLPASLKDAKVRLDDGTFVPMPSLTPRPSQRSMDDYFRQDPIGPAVMRALNHHRDRRTGFAALFLDERWPDQQVASALLCVMTGENQWENTRIVWIPDEVALKELDRQAYVDPGPFRERLLAKACRLASEALFAPLVAAAQEAELERLILSAPGRYGRLPFEAFATQDGSALDSSMSITYLPSVRFAVDILDSSPDDTPDHERSRVLVVGYDGDDMPHQAEEIASLGRIWGDRATVLPGGESTKLAVLRALQGEYDVIHLLCHGTFNHASPMDSALHFCSDRDDDRRRVSARDLLAGTSLGRQPIVILSACSSGITADSRTNSFHGLSGALFRIGARGVMGSRWPVYDDAAPAVMESLHRKLHSSGEAPDMCLRRARSELREAGAKTEEWAAFGYFGVI